VGIAAERNQLSPVADYLKGLKWDGVDRLDSWLVRYCGAPDTPFSAAAGRWWMISAAARALSPGCKVDHCLVLEGRQGSGKSSAFRALCPDPRWFTDSEPQIGNKDAYLSIAGFWLVELAELDGITSRRESASIKSFITSAIDHYRPPYGARTISAKRTCVFCGTVNRSEYLRDETGNRRFWPVRTGADGAIKLGALGDVRDQLWAEARARYEGGEVWYPVTTEEHGLCREEQAERFVVDPWQEIIASWLRTTATADITAGDLLLRAVKMDRDKQNRHAQQRVGEIMAALGYHKVRRRVDGRQRRVFELIDPSAAEARPEELDMPF
jgi:predicted P-loop ATPase